MSRQAGVWHLAPGPQEGMACIVSREGSSAE
jgi:hypothetical protein